MAAIEVDGRAIEVTSADRVVFPDAGLTKGDVVAYYVRIAPHLLPHLQGRPLTLQRFPSGISGPGFWSKERPKHFPDWVGAASVPVREKRRHGELVMAVVDDAASLAFVANQGCITPHVWLSRADRPTHPDRVVFDLDPGQTSFDVVRAAALDLKDLLERSGLVPFVKSTGSSGLHVTVPIERTSTTEEAHAFADAVAAELAARAPSERTTAFRKAERGDRLYVDVARNGFAQTEVVAYGLRPLPEAPVAAPLEWDEVEDRRLTPRRWTVANVFRRLAARPDPWAGLALAARQLPAGFREQGDGYPPGMQTDDLKGKAKEAAGDLTGDKDLKDEGKVDQGAANVKEKVGNVVDSVKDKLQK